MTTHAAFAHEPDKQFFQKIDLHLVSLLFHVFREALPGDALPCSSAGSAIEIWEKQK